MDNIDNITVTAEDVIVVTAEENEVIAITSVDDEPIISIIDIENEYIVIDASYTEEESVNITDVFVIEPTRKQVITAVDEYLATIPFLNYAIISKVEW